MTYLGRGAGLTGYLELARELGFDAYKLAAALGVPAAALTDPDLKISSLGISRMYDEAARLSGADDFALRIAERRRLQNLGLTGFLAREQSTLRQALKIVARYVWLQNEAFSLHVEEADDLALLKFVMAAPIGRQQADLVVGVSLSVMRGLLGDAWQPLDVCFTHAAPANLDAYRRVFGCLPRFEEDFLGLVIRRGELDSPIASTNSAARKPAVQAERPVALRDKVRDLITLMLPGGDCTIDQIARRMGMDRRTLYRRLAAEGASFSEILDLTRCAHAESLLTNGDPPLQNVSDQLGFPSLRAFDSWFRKRFNCTAAEYRASRQAQQIKS